MYSKNRLASVDKKKKTRPNFRAGEVHVDLCQIVSRQAVKQMTNHPSQIFAAFDDTTFTVLKVDLSPTVQCYTPQRITGEPLLNRVSNKDVHVGLFIETGRLLIKLKKRKKKKCECLCVEF